MHHIMKTKKWGSIKSIYSVGPDLQKICHFFTASFVSLATSFANKDGLRMPRQTWKTGTKTQWKTFFTFPALPSPPPSFSIQLSSTVTNSMLLGQQFAHHLHATWPPMLVGKGWSLRSCRASPSLANFSHTICMHITNHPPSVRSIGLFVFYKMSLREYAQRNCVYFAKMAMSESVLPCLCGCLPPYARWV